MGLFISGWGRGRGGARGVEAASMNTARAMAGTPYLGPEIMQSVNYKRMGFTVNDAFFGQSYIRIRSR